MKSRSLTLFLILMLVGLGYLAWKFIHPGAGINSAQGLIRPILSYKAINPTASPMATAAPSDVPKTYTFGKSTDLKQELQKVDPQVLDSDFQ